MNKIRVLFLILIAAFAFTGCDSLSNSKIRTMEKRVETLKSEVSKLQNDSERMKNEMLSTPKLLQKMKDQLDNEKNKVKDLPFLLEKKNRLEQELKTLREQNAKSPAGEGKNPPESK
ncbi:MAG: hypothetical protein LWY06_18000 [Firmicutes bacterium]|nr:hypothetical protein [Bacillota bacterium]